MGEGRGEGASTFNPQPSTLIHRLTHGRGLDAAIIAVPSDAVVCQTQAWLRGGGQLLLFAHTRRSAPSLNPQPSTLNFPLDLASICVDEKDLLGSYSADFTLQAEVARLVFFAPARRAPARHTSVPARTDRRGRPPRRPAHARFIEGCGFAGCYLTSCLTRLWPDDVRGLESRLQAVSAAVGVQA